MAERPGQPDKSHGQQLEPNAPTPPVVDHAEPETPANVIDQERERGQHQQARRAQRDVERAERHGNASEARQARMLWDKEQAQRAWSIEQALRVPNVKDVLELAKSIHAWVSGGGGD